MAAAPLSDEGTSVPVDSLTRSHSDGGHRQSRYDAASGTVVSDRSVSDLNAGRQGGIHVLVHSFRAERPLRKGYSPDGSGPAFWQAPDQSLHKDHRSAPDWTVW